MDVVDTHRRALLFGRALTRTGRAQLARERLPLGPAPPGLQGPAHEDDCLDCDRACAAACERQLIHFHPDNHRLAGRPFLSFERSGCTFCGDCVNTCPSSAKDTGHMELGTAEIDISRCMAWQNTVCISCRHACDDRAIELEAHMRPVVSTAKCTGCGACVPVCPTQAIKISI